MRLEAVFEHYKERASQHLELDENFVENLSKVQPPECAKQHVNVIKTAAVQKAYKERNLSVHGWVFDIHASESNDLKIDFAKRLEGIRGKMNWINTTSLISFIKEQDK